MKSPNHPLLNTWLRPGAGRNRASVQWVGSAPRSGLNNPLLSARGQTDQPSGYRLVGAPTPAVVCLPPHLPEVARADEPLNFAPLGQLIAVRGGCMNNHELNREGRRNVEAELLRRGAASVTSRGTRKIYLHVTNSNQSRTVELQVKTKRKGNWHTRTDEAKPSGTPMALEDVRHFWVFVDLGGTPRYRIVPNGWIRNDFHEAHQQYLNKHGGHRAQNDDSNHHSIHESRLENWQNTWDILGIF